jgi:ATP-dependent exoDNAse (exonuclease V) beta subunit
VILDGLCCPDSIQDERLRQILEDTKKIYKRISVGEILHLYLKTLQENDEFVEWVANNVNYILVDEAQDLSHINYQIFDTLIEKIPNLKLFLVGDPRQNIFGFLGGSYKHLDAFPS